MTPPRLRHAFILVPCLGMLLGTPTSLGGSGVPVPAAQTALAFLVDGNSRFAEGSPQHPNTDHARVVESAASDPQPFATILAPADSRLPIERLFDRGVGDLFVLRTPRGDDPGGFVPGVEQGVVDLATPLAVVLEATTGSAEDARQAPDRARARQASVLTHSAKVRDAITSGRASLVGAVYDLSTGRVSMLGEHPEQAALIARANAPAPIADLTPPPAPEASRPGEFPSPSDPGRAPWQRVMDTARQREGWLIAGVGALLGLLVGLALARRAPKPEPQEEPFLREAAPSILPRGMPAAPLAPAAPPGAGGMDPSRAHAIARSLEQALERIEQGVAGVVSMERRSAEVGGLIAQVERLGEECRLLALSAGVEAARAGEKGQGFAPIAGELRELSERMGESAGSFERTIRALQGGPPGALAHLREGLARARACGQSLADPGEGAAGSARAA